MIETAFLVRHGDYSRGTERALTNTGQEQSRIARDILIAKNLGGKAYLLSSDAPRAMETAVIIGEGLETEVLPSSRLNAGGNMRNAVEHIGDFLVTTLLKDAGIEADPDRPFVVVTHAPLVVTFAGKSSPDEVEYGGVYEVPLDQIDPRYNRLAAEASFPEDFLEEL